MNVAIIGLGNMGKGLARRLAGKVELTLATRKAGDAQALAAELGAKAGEVDAAIAGADVVVLALPYGEALELAGSAKLDGKVLVDISNPVNATFSGLTVGHSSSAAEEIQKAATGAKVVKAFNTIFAGLFDKDTTAVPVFVAGNDEAAVATVAALVAKSGFAVEKVGGLDGARLVEPVGMLNIRLGYGLGKGTAIAPAWVTV